MIRGRSEPWRRPCSSLLCSGDPHGLSPTPQVGESWGQGRRCPGPALMPGPRAWQAPRLMQSTDSAAVGWGGACGSAFLADVRSWRCWPDTAVHLDTPAVVRGLQRQHLRQGFAAHDAVPIWAAAAAPRSLLKIQSLRPHPRLYRSESVFKPDPQGIHRHSKV